MIQIDAIGLIYEPVTYTGAESIDTPPPQPQPRAGWHVNTTAPVADWAAQRVEPATPRRVFAGVETYCYTWPDEQAWLAALETADLTEPPAPVPVPERINRRQAKLALLGAGLLAQAEAALDALPEPQRTAALINWADAPGFDRDDPLLAAMAQALGLDDAALDALFVAGAAL